MDYLIDDYDSLSAVPIEVKSGKDYTVHSALNTFVKNAIRRPQSCGIWSKCWTRSPAIKISRSRFGGSGGMFVQAARYMHAHNANEAEQMSSAATERRNRTP